MAIEFTDDCSDDVGPTSQPSAEEPGDGGVPTRRTFLAGAGATALAGLAAACSSEAPAEGASTQAATSAAPDLATDVLPTPTAAGTTSVAPQGAAVEAFNTVDAAEPVAFAAPHQAAVLEPPSAAGLVAAFDVVTGDRETLTETLQRLSAEMRRIMRDEPAVPDESYKPPVDSGAVDTSTSTSGTAIALAVGASLFDERFGLAARRPTELIPMPRFFNDRLVRPDLSDGDVALIVSGPSQQAVVYALHQAVRVTERRLRLRWVQEGYNDLLPPDPQRVAPTRNLMGFRDGSSNLDTTNAEEMDEHVWVAADDPEPEWATGGTYLAVRIIRMQIEFWATAALVRQEQIFGRHRDTGAPLGQQREDEEPAFAADQDDDGVPRRSHMRLANPRTAGTGRILRRGFSYLNGVDATDATMDQGLLFLAYQRSLNRGFLAAQSRLDGEPLEDYVKPVGGGLFFVLPGPGDAPDAWLGQALFA